VRGNGETPTTYDEAVYEVVHHSNVPPKQIADYLGIGESTLYNAANPHLNETSLSRKHIVPITRRTRNFAILDYFEHACGRVAFEVPAAGGTFTDVTREVSALAREFGELLATIAAALEDNGRIDRDELPVFNERCLEMIKAVARCAEAGRREAKGDQP